MSRIGNVFTKDRTALIGYITSGYPDIDATVDTAVLLAGKGCDIIELGIPFSDPLADGVTIQNSSYHALQNGITVESCLEMAAGIRKKIDTPLDPFWCARYRTRVCGWFAGRAGAIGNPRRMCTSTARSRWTPSVAQAD